MHAVDSYLYWLSGTLCPKFLYPVEEDETETP